MAGQISLYASDDVAIRTEGSVLYDEGPHATVGDIYEFDYIPCSGGWKAVDESYPYDYYYS